MKSTTTFIADALTGGWLWINLSRYYKVENVVNDHDFCIEIELLKPEFWQAVGKTRGWWTDIECSNNNPETYWKKQWHRFIDHLADRDTIEEALSALDI